MAQKEGKVWRCGSAQSYQSEVYCFDSLLVEGVLRHIPTPPIVSLHHILLFYLFLLRTKTKRLSPKSEVTNCLEHSKRVPTIEVCHYFPFAAVTQINPHESAPYVEQK